MVFKIQNNYGDNYEVQSGAIVIAGGSEAALYRKEVIDKIKKEAEETGISFSELMKKYKDNVVDAEMIEEDTVDEEPNIPSSLRKKDVLDFLEKLKDEGILDENFQPKAGNRNASILADYIGKKFNLKSRWKDFAELWGMNKEVLRSTFNNITDSEKDKAFYKRLNKL